MKSQDEITYQRVAEALFYLQKNFRKQPQLEEVAEKAYLSPFHFQRVFTEWAGVSPKKFLQYISLSHAKKILKESPKSLLEASYDLGLSGPGRLHDLFINIEGMTPGEYKEGGKSLVIKYSITASPFGHLLIASTSKGICQMDFLDEKGNAVQELKANFPNANLIKQLDPFHQNGIDFIQQDWRNPEPITLHLKGSPFQLKVWEALLKIPLGQLSTYGQLATIIQNPKAARAVGSAIGRNPIAFLIPCHRVIQSSGIIGEYKWGSERKTAMLGWESSQVYGE